VVYGLENIITSDHLILSRAHFGSVQCQIVRRYTYWNEEHIHILCISFTFLCKIRTSHKLRKILGKHMFWNLWQPTSEHRRVIWKRLATRGFSSPIWARQHIGVAMIYDIFAKVSLKVYKVETAHNYVVFFYNYGFKVKKCSSSYKEKKKNPSVVNNNFLNSRVLKAKFWISLATKQ